LTIQRVRWLRIGGLWAVVVVQPLLDLTGANPEFFIAHRARPADIVLLIVALTIALPAILAAIVWVAARAGPRASTAALYCVLAALAGLQAMQLVVRAGAETWPATLAAASAAGAGVVLAYRTWASVRSFFSVLSIAALIVPGVFFSQPGIGTLVFGASQSANAAPAPNGKRGGSASTVVLSIFDELPLVSLLDAGRNIDAALYPNLAALAKDAVWFRNATTVDDFTRYALPAILSGRYPERPALPSAVDYPNTLFTLVHRTHRLEVSEAVTALCPATLCTPVDAGSAVSRLAAMGRDLRVVFLHLILTPDLTRGLPDPSTTWAGFGTYDAAAPGDPDAQPQDEAGAGSDADRVRDRWRQGIAAARVAPVRQFIAGISREDPQPTLYFLHTLISHQPHHMLPIGRENKTWNLLPGRRGWNRDEPWTVAQHYQRHLLQVGYVDYLIGRLVAQLKSVGLYDRALIVITSDHGVSYLPNAPQRTLIDRTADEIMRVPLLVKFPKSLGIASRISDDNVESIDILPTIADVLDLDVPWHVDGSSLVDSYRPARRTKQMFSGDRRRRQNFSATGPDIVPALERKLELFGDGTRNRQRAPRLAAFESLIGQPLAALRIVDGGPTAEITDAWEFEHVDLATPAIPFDVSGRFASPLPRAAVALGINGVIEAVTQTWESNARGWSATPRFDAWRQGRNAIDIFLIERDPSGLVLRRTMLKGVRPAGLNLVSAAAANEWGVVQGGLYPREARADGTEFRWTRDRAELTNLSTHERPQAVRVDVLKVPENKPKLLTIEANDCVLFRGQVGSGWSGTLPLDRCSALRGELTLRFTTTVSRGRTDPRRLGVALSRVAVQ
jgi:hypothetical protein